MGHSDRGKNDTYYDVSFTNPYFGSVAPPGDFIFFDLSQSLFRVVDPLSRRVNEESMDINGCLLYTSPSPRDLSTSRMPSSA